MQNQIAPEVAQISNELTTLEARREEIARECRSAKAALKSAESAAIDGAPFEAVVAAQARATAMESTLEAMQVRLSQKRAELAAAEAHAQRQEHENELFAAGVEFQEKRAALEGHARDFAAQFEGGFNELMDLLRAASKAQLKVEGAAYSMGSAPQVLERDGQRVDVGAARSQGPSTFSALAASFGDGVTRRLLADGIETRFALVAETIRLSEQAEREQRGHNIISRELEEEEIASPTAYADPSKVEVRSFSR